MYFLARMACNLVSLFRILLASHLLCITSSSNGFSSKLIYRDSPYSPLYQSNLSYLKAFRRDIQTSRSRAFNLVKLFETDSSNILLKDTLKLSLFFWAPLFTLEVGIGKPTTKARLVFDTAAPLIWTQCQPCINCFKQDYPIFDPSKSSSYKRMRRNHTLAPSFNCTLLECYYYVKTRGGASSQGIVSVDHFSFLGTTEEIKDIVFGCGTNNHGSIGPNKMFTGLLGMGNFPTSLVGQLGERVMRRFSYCLPELKSSRTKKSDISFGQAAVMNGKNVQTTPFLRRRKGSYVLNLLGISVAGKKLEIPKASFDGGCIIDAGAPFSIIEEQAYKVLLDAISSYFSQFKKVKQIVNRKYPKNLCYKYPRGFRNFPSMILHFDGASMEVNGTSLFMFGRNIFLSNFICLQMLGEPKTNILGVYQQQNIRFLYDLRNNKLSFARENC